MSVTIETDVGTFVADDEDAAAKLVKAARRKKVADDKRTAASIAAAYRESQIAGFKVLSRHHDKMPEHWELLRSDDAGFPSYHRKTSFGEVKVYSVECGGGRGCFEVYKQTVVNSLIDTAGFTICLWIREDTDLLGTQGCVTAYAVGCCDGHCGLQALPKCIRASSYMKGVP